MQSEEFKQPKIPPRKHPNHSFIELFFSPSNDILRFPLFFDDKPQRLVEIKSKGGLLNFSQENLKQLQDVFQALKCGDYSHYSPERVLYLDFLKNSTCHLLHEYISKYDNFEKDLLCENNRFFAVEYFSRISEITRQLGYVNGYLSMFYSSFSNYDKIEKLEQTIRDLKKQCSHASELRTIICDLEILSVPSHISLK